TPPAHGDFRQFIGPRRGAAGCSAAVPEPCGAFENGCSQSAVILWQQGTTMAVELPGVVHGGRRALLPLSHNGLSSAAARGEEPGGGEEREAARSGDEGGGVEAVGRVAVLDGEGGGVAVEGLGGGVDLEHGLAVERVAAAQDVRERAAAPDV